MMASYIPARERWESEKTRIFKVVTLHLSLAYTGVT